MTEPSLDDLIPVVQAELQRMAHRRMARERDDHTLNTTGLVHEAYLLAVVRVNGTREFGLRISLGASGGHVRRVVLRSGSRIGLLGIAIGLVAALGA